ncbi:hypothetical protein [Rhodococcus sp. 15-649-2-2]|nr:hypothetical protein [Rhodococcus sp. 15-649-2-2]
MSNDELPGTPGPPGSPKKLDEVYPSGSSASALAGGTETMADTSTQSRA